MTLTPSPIASAAQLALSPDGRRLAFVAARKRAASQLWIRPLDGVAGTTPPRHRGRVVSVLVARQPVHCVFRGWQTQERSIRPAGCHRCSVTQQPAAAVPGTADGIIVFTGQANSPISRISASGGVVTAATTFDPDQAVISQYWPQFLPDGRHFLYYQRSSKPEHRGVHVTALDSSSSTRILESDGMALYASGHLLFVRDGTLFAQAFDDRALQTSGDPVRIGDHVGYYVCCLRLRGSDRIAGRCVGPRPQRGADHEPALARPQRSVNGAPNRAGAVQLSAPVARSEERRRGNDRCGNGAARSLGVGAGPWHHLAPDVRSGSPTGFQSGPPTAVACSSGRTARG